MPGRTPPPPYSVDQPMRRARGLQMPLCRLAAYQDPDREPRHCRPHNLPPLSRPAAGQSSSRRRTPPSCRARSPRPPCSVDRPAHLPPDRPAAPCRPAADRSSLRRDRPPSWQARTPRPPWSVDRPAHLPPNRPAAPCRPAADKSSLRRHTPPSCPARSPRPPCSVDRPAHLPPDRPRQNRVRQIVGRQDLPERRSRADPTTVASTAPNASGSLEPSMHRKFRFVCATRHTVDAFFQQTALGRCLPHFSNPSVELRLFETNSAPLPAAYNQAISESQHDPAVLVFVHDDVCLCDLFWSERLAEGLSAFDVIGVAGNRRRVPRQPSWAFIDDRFTWDAKENLSGMVAHGRGFPPENVSNYGPAPQPVKLLDGLMLVCKSGTLLSTGIRFDEQFDFHFYDLDFCRQAELHGLKLGTWPISVVHESGGAAGSTAWRSAYVR